MLTTAVDEDKILARNPCRVRGAGDEQTGERPVLTVAQVFELADLLGRHSFGNIRKVIGGYRLRYARNGQMRAHPEVFATRSAAEWALWTIGLPRVFRTANLMLIHAASCRFRYSSWTSCGVL